MCKGLDQGGRLVGPGSLSLSVRTTQNAQSSRPSPELGLYTYTKGAGVWEGLQQLGVEVRGGF